ncbi:glyceraldehyde 3-phosphate dehydrogenase NAD-binding domain-containing protein [Marinospirillum sp.]|uniref:type I glyceraldehyde-3-phosphate dehydrogenase n=1 Tax=Marinospirillum sp. TaxID=2183934 RepID=UPI002870A4D5|nr:glyceraldehyde 3-phosphate dehydrogenase NAD-binding domain-containing protein [Marinospirillum sp.]MDR9469224.1 glyceraldehyde 3-phosphate dehydrogenase NAD-binding domain-containing protein [Marinospirillum sp.]
MPQPPRLAINGYGRIGQCILRAFIERQDCRGLELVALNELSDLETVAYLTRYDTIHGRFPGQVTTRDSQLLINDQPVNIFSHSEPEDLPWQQLGIDLLLECSGSFKDRATAERHLQAGASKLLFSQPAEADVDATIIYGINQQELSPDQQVISAGSCTTNCVVPVLKLLDETFGIEHGTTTTIHSAMNDQPVSDAYHQNNLRLTRSAMASIIPVDTGLARGVSRLLPHLDGRLESLHLRVPTLNVSAMDMTLCLQRDTSVSEINQLLQQASLGPLKGILGYTEEPHASVDFNHDPHSAIIDATQTRVSGKRLVKLLCWFDNEWGFANRMLDIAIHWLNTTNSKH